jgi:head-tail adaptor
VWDTQAPVGRLVVHPRSDRMRKIVVETGRDGLGQWRRYRRNLAADYRLAFGEAPGPLLAVAVMTDSDNTRSQLTTRYRDIVLR